MSTSVGVPSATVNFSDKGTRTTVCIPGTGTVQELLGHSDGSTTMIYTHVLKIAAGGTASPLDSLQAA